MFFTNKKIKILLFFTPLLTIFMSLQADDKRVNPGMSGGDNSCYFNSTLQCLSNCGELTKYLLKNKNLYTTDSIPGQYIKLLKNLRDSKSSLSPNKFYTKIQDVFFPTYSKNKQHDAAEFYLELINSITEKNKNASKLFKIETTTVISHDIDSTEGKKTHIISETKVKENRLFLYIKEGKKIIENLADVLKNYTQKETLTDQKKRYCSLCNKDVYANKKQFLISTTPLFLVLTLRRYDIKGSYGSYSGEKLSHPVTFPLELTLKKEWSTKDLHNQDKTYKLIGFVQHSGSFSVTKEGKESSSGHYTSYAKDYKSGQWAYFNDSSVKKKTKENIKEIAGNKGLDGPFTPYILFYKKIDQQIGEKIDQQIAPKTSQLEKSQLENLKQKLEILKESLNTLKKNLINLTTKLGILKKSLETLKK